MGTDDFKSLPLGMVRGAGNITDDFNPGTTILPRPWHGSITTRRGRGREAGGVNRRRGLCVDARQGGSRASASPRGCRPPPRPHRSPPILGVVVPPSPRFLRCEDRRPVPDEAHLPVGPRVSTEHRGPQGSVARPPRTRRSDAAWRSQWSPQRIPTIHGSPPGTERHRERKSSVIFMPERLSPRGNA